VQVLHKAGDSRLNGQVINQADHTRVLARALSVAGRRTWVIRVRGVLGYQIAPRVARHWGAEPEAQRRHEGQQR
jgi:hypothetical protein